MQHAILVPSQLLLLPETDAASKVTLKTPDGHKKHGLMQYAGHILPPAFYKAGDHKLHTGFTSPYWWVQPAEANNLDFLEVAVTGKNMVRCLTNPKSIKKHEKLTLPMPLEAEAAPSQ